MIFEPNPRKQSYANGPAAERAIKTWSIKYPVLKDFMVVLHVRWDRVWPVLLPTDDQIELGITLSRVTPFTTWVKTKGTTDQ